MEDSSQSQIVSEDTVSASLSSFRFKNECVYSHKSNTVFINAKNYSKLEDIINHEISTPSVQDNGFLVIRLSTALFPNVTDSSMTNFLVTGGDHDDCKQKLTPMNLNLINMGIENFDNDSSGVFFTQNQLSLVSGIDIALGQLKTFKGMPKLVREVEEGIKSIGIDIDEEGTIDSAAPLTKKPRLSKIPPTKSSSSAGRPRRIVSRKTMLSKDFMEEVNVEPDTDAIPTRATLKVFFQDFEEGSNPWGKLVDGAFPEDLASCPCGHPGKCLVDVARSKKTRKGNKRKISNDYILENEREPAPLLHEAYFHYKRLKNIVNECITQDSVRHMQSERLYENDLLAFESVLKHMLVSPNYCYNYLMHNDFVDIESNEGGFLKNMSHYDMGTHKNFLDECIDGTWDNGISYPWTYIGFSGSLFTTHVEDLYCLNSINLMLYGGTKLWIFVSPKHKEKLQEKAVEYMNKFLVVKDFAPCTLVHKNCFLHPGLLEMWDIPFKIFIQRPGDLVVTASGSFHWGINLNVNLNYAKNTIYSDYKQRMLSSIYNPHTDRLLCKVTCNQRMDDMIGLESNHKFLRAFYHSTFKSSDGKVNALIQTYYNKCDNMDPEAKCLEQEINVHLSTLRRAMDKTLTLTAAGVRKILAKLSCDSIKLHREEITIPEFSVVSPRTDDHWFPSPNLKCNVSIAQEDCIFNKVPYTHIMVTHTAFPNWRSSVTSSTNEKEEEGIVTRYFQYYKQIIEYWSSIKINVDYQKVGVIGEDDVDGDHAMLETDFSIGDVNVSAGTSTEYTSAPSSSHSDEVNNIKVLKKFTRTYLPRFNEVLFPTSDQYFLLKQSGKLALYEVNKRLYYVCTICYHNLNDHLDTATFLHQENNLSIPLSEYLEQTMQKKNGIFSELANLRHHISQNSNSYKCLLCVPGYTKKSFKSKYSVTSHIRDSHQHHAVVCPLCNKEFNHPSKLRRHWSSPDSACIYVDLLFGKGNEVKVESCLCSVCKFQFAKIEEWKKHMKESDKCRVALGWVIAPKTITSHEKAPVMRSNNTSSSLT